MARGGKARSGTGPVDEDHATSGGDVSMSPAASSSPRTSRTPGATSTGLANGKKRKRGDDSRTPKRSKRAPSGSASIGDDGGDGSVHDKSMSTVKLEDADEAEAMDEDSAPTDDPEPHLQPVDAARILSVLESVDTPSHALDTQHTVDGLSSSLRQLLLNPSSLSLKALRERIRRTTPPNAQISETQLHRHASSSRAAHKLDPALARFYGLAVQLLDDVAESYGAAAYLDALVLEETPTANENDAHSHSVASTSKANPLLAPRYALHQHLPTGDYFTSAVPLTRTELRALPKGYASYVEVHPAPPIPAHAFPTLGTYAVSSSTPPRRPPGPAQRTSTLAHPPRSTLLSAASFIDYGPFSSLAPCFDSEGMSVGRETMGLLGAWRRESVVRGREARGEVGRALKRTTGGKKSISTSNSSAPSRDGSIDVDGRDRDRDSASANANANAMAAELDRLVIDPSLQLDAASVIPDAHSSAREQIRSLASSLVDSKESGISLDGILEAFDESTLRDELTSLLARNSRALRRLEELQAVRFRAGLREKGKEVGVVQGSEEWMLGRRILASLCAVVGLRLRVDETSSSSSSSSLPHDPSIPSSPSPFIPSRTTLHTLAQSVPRAPRTGWKGTLSQTRDFALHDNTTIRPTAAAYAMPAPPIASSSSSSAVPAPATAPALPPTPAVGGAGGQYYPHPQQYQTPVRPSAVGAYNSYAPRPTAHPQGSYTPSPNPNHTPNPARAVPPPTHTPHGPTTTAYYSPTAYQSYAPSPSSQTPNRAIPNLAAGAAGMKPNGPGTWATGGIPGGMALPAHLRQAGGARPMSPAGALYGPNSAQVGVGVGGVAKPPVPALAHGNGQWGGGTMGR